MTGQPYGQVDLRLAGPIAGIWVGCLVVIGRTGPAGLALAVLAAAGAAAALVAGWASGAGSTGARRPGLARAPSPRRSAWWLAAAILLGTCAGAAVTAHRLAVRDSSPLVALARGGVPVQLRLRVADDPKPIRANAGRPAQYLVPVHATQLETASGPHRLDSDVLLLTGNPAWQALLPGTAVTAVGRLSPARSGDLAAAVLDTTQAPSQVGRAPWVQRAAGGIRTGLRDACSGLPAAPAGLLPGLVLGDTSKLDPRVAADFRTTGMTHLVAVSGANLAIFLAAILLAARWTRIGPAAAAAWCSVALVGFVVLVRPSPSVLRAACMGGIALLGLAVGRPRATLPALTATIGILLLDEPALATQVGFALSAAATAGLLLIGPHLTRLLRRWRVPAAPAEALAVATAAQLACAPVIAGLSGTVSLVAVPANLLAEPAVPPATLLGLGAALLHPLWPGGAAFLAWLAAWPTRWLILVAARGAALPGAVLSWPSGVAGAVLLGVVTLVGVLVLRRRAIRVAAVTCLASLWCGWCGVQLVAASTWPPAHPLLVACDVGQGDALVLPTGPAAAVVVDTGPIPGPTDQCLAELRVRTVPLLLLTHFHADHVGGIAGVYGHGRAVGEVLTSPYREPIPGYQAVLAVAAAHATPVVVPPLGWTTAIGSIALQVLGPPNLIQGTTSDPNNNSLVVMVREGGYRLLLAGDAQVEEQAAILARAGPGAVRADVLKVAHHGSAYQDLAFLAAVAPVLALVSVGAGNPYGHPSLAVLADLRRAGARVLRTDTDGEIAAVLDHGQLAAQARGLPPGQHPP